MHLKTTRFGDFRIDPDDVIRFPQGVIGLEECTDWVLLADAQNSALGWLQCASRPEVALAVVSPRRFVPEYQVRVFRKELTPLDLSTAGDAQVLAVVGREGESLTLNLKAPLLINIERRLGRQVVTNGEALIQHKLHSPQTLLRKSA